MSNAERARVEAGGGAGAEGKAALAAAPFVSLSQDEVVLVLSVTVQTLSRLVRTSEVHVAAAREVCVAWAAREPVKDDAPGRLEQVRRAAERALARAERVAEEALKQLRTISARATGLCRDTWTCVPPGLSAADADRVRAGHPIWPHVIDLRYGGSQWARLMCAVHTGNLARVRELCDWRADVEAADRTGYTPLIWASLRGHLDVVRELLARGAVVNATVDSGWTPLIYASYYGIVEVVRALLAAGADKRRVTDVGDTAASLAGQHDLPSRAAILALLTAAP
jgi:Ankyrin repeats (many copies)